MRKGVNYKIPGVICLLISNLEIPSSSFFVDKSPINFICVPSLNLSE